MDLCVESSEVSSLYLLDYRCNTLSDPCNWSPFIWSSCVCLVTPSAPKITPFIQCYVVLLTRVKIKIYGLFTLAIFSSEKRAIFFSLRLVLVFCIVLFRLAIFQRFSQARTKIARKQMGAVPIQASYFCSL